jgi:hypothetical protein
VSSGISRKVNVGRHCNADEGDPVGSFRIGGRPAFADQGMTIAGYVSALRSICLLPRISAIRRLPLPLKAREIGLLGENIMSFQF